MINSNEPIKAAHLQELTICGRNGKQFFQCKQEKPWSFDKARNVLIEKEYRDMGNRDILLNI